MSQGGLHVGVMDWLSNHPELIFSIQFMATASTIFIVIKRELS